MNRQDAKTPSICCHPGEGRGLARIPAFAGMTILAFVLTFVSSAVFAADIATCGESSGYAYDSFRGLAEKKDVGWKKDGISGGKFTLTIDEKGNLDLLTSGALGVSSSVAEGAKIIPATISDEAATVVVLYPNRLVETYVFQKLKNGKYQAIWTQAKAETPLPRVTALVSDCDFVDLSEIQ